MEVTPKRKMEEHDSQNSIDPKRLKTQAGAEANEAKTPTETETKSPPGGVGPHLAPTSSPVHTPDFSSGMLTTTLISVVSLRYVLLCAAPVDDPKSFLNHDDTTSTIIFPLPCPTLPCSFALAVCSMSQSLLRRLRSLRRRRQEQWRGR
jgi:hypothetical protein